jgi:hypothetical protein
MACARILASSRAVRASKIPATLNAGSSPRLYPAIATGAGTKLPGRLQSTGHNSRAWIWAWACRRGHRATTTASLRAASPVRKCAGIWALMTGAPQLQEPNGQNNRGGVRAQATFPGRSGRRACCRLLDATSRVGVARPRMRLALEDHQRQRGGVRCARHAREGQIRPAQSDETAVAVPLGNAFARA